ncbi:uncharacterized protein LOC131202840 [Ahaetulla prasina]|uniref:uncharacterized protein LOC131202840 n=1 Tax=Ahaetulla prasina TaxID=499056 RepID=UPI00264963C9|nr:uncharacterized protein LOC131202840 [Ahaetulla prasina]
MSTCFMWPCARGDLSLRAIWPNVLQPYSDMIESPVTLSRNGVSACMLEDWGRIQVLIILEPKKSKSSGWGKSTREQSGAICKGSWLKDWQGVRGAATRRGTGSGSALPAASLPPSQGSSALLFHLLRLLVHASGVIPGQERSINTAAAAPAPPGREAVPGTRCKIRPGPLASRNGHDDPHLIPPPASTHAVCYLGRKISSARTEQERIQREAGEAVNF